MYHSGLTGAQQKELVYQNYQFVFLRVFISPVSSSGVFEHDTKVKNIPTMMDNLVISIVSQIPFESLRSGNVQFADTVV